MRKLILIFLLATCGSASAQLVLQICTAQIPCPGFPLGSVQAGVDQNGWRNFKVTLTQNVSLFSIVGTPPPSQASVNVIFTQDATGGRTVTFASNISNPCTIATAASATTLCQFEFDGIVGTWFGISGGSGTPGGSINQVQFFSPSGGFGGSSALTWDGKTFVVNSTSSANALFNPGFFQANFNGATNSQQVAAISATGSNASNGTVARLVGVSANVNNVGAGTITEADDFIAGANGALGGTVPLFIGMRIQNHNAEGATQAFGEVVDSGTNAIALGGTGGPTLSAGAGAPTGVLAAPVGSLYYQTDGTPGNALYVKTSATDNSGWDAVPSNLSPLPTPEGYLNWQPSNLLTQTCATNTITMPGARKDNDFLAEEWPSTLPAGIVGIMRISASDTVEVRICNPTASTVTFTAQITFGAKVVR